ncbi:SPFH domain-containing protein [Mesorhizobium sp. IMUNJ 23232]|uniref:SPFH domain-containing protein n=1 Tax=Mesorhizobium sp. IMUNJ 23232 TaxID=3376064 RepID=UPI0037A1E242
MQAVSDHEAWSVGGFPLLFLWLALMGAAALLLWPLIIPIAVIGVLFASGFTIIQPNEARVVTFFGRYVGTLRKNGFLYTVPFSSKTRVPLKLINFVTDHLKVNDRNGNPIEIGAVVVWRVTDAAQASFNIDDYKTFVANQSDIAIRTLAAHYPYDSESETSLRGNIDEVAAQLQTMLQGKLAVAGIHVEETRLSHLAYASEIAGAMLKRQQAVAIFQARRYMVENALAIIDEVMVHFDKQEGVEISDDKKADLINSLLVVMTSEKESNPVINVGR